MGVNHDRFPGESSEVRAQTMHPFLRSAIQGLPPKVLPLPIDGCKPRPLPPLGFASSVVLEPAAIFRRRLFFFCRARLRPWVTPLAEREFDFGEVVAVLIVFLGLIPFASAGLW